jgi:hypothetical protein
MPEFFAVTAGTLQNYYIRPARSDEKRDHRVGEPCRDFKGGWNAADTLAFESIA